MASATSTDTCSGPTSWRRFSGWHLASIFKSAVADRLIAVSPCDRISLPKIDRKRVIPLETEQVLALAGALPERYQALVVLAAGTGLRQGEAFGLTVPNVDFLRAARRCAAAGARAEPTAVPRAAQDRHER